MFLIDSEDGLRITGWDSHAGNTPSKAVIASDLLTPDTTYSFSVVLTNSYGQESIFEGSVYKESQPIPALMLIADDVLDRGKANHLRGQVALSQCSDDGDPPPLAYEWTCTACPAGTVLNEKTRNTPELYIEANSLRPPSLLFDGSYMLTLTITDEDNPFISVSKHVEFRVRSSQVKAMIAGGDTIVSRSSSLVLDGSFTVDPDDMFCGDDCSDFVYTWTCRTNEDTPTSCYDDELLGYSAGAVISSDAVLSIQEEQLKLAPSPSNSELRLIFELDVMKDPASRFPQSTGRSSTSVELTVVSGQVPKCNIAARDVVALPQEPLVIFGSATQTPEQGTLSYRWYEADHEATGTGLDLSGLADLPLGYQTIGAGLASHLSAPLKIGPNQLSAGSEYSFALHVTETTDLGTTECVSSMTILMNEAPSGGTTSVTPTSGVKMQQQYTAEWIGWLDDQLPLTYSITLFDETLASSQSYLKTPSQSNVLRFKVPLSGDLVLALHVTDAYGSGSVMDVDITSIDGEYDDSTASSDVAKAKATADNQALMTTAIAYTAQTRRLRRAQDTQDAAQCVTCEIVEALEQALARSVLTLDDVSMYLTTLQELVDFDGTEDILEIFADVIGSGMSLGLTQEIGNQAIAVAGGLSAFAESACTDGNEMASRTLVQTRLQLIELARGLLLHALAGETSTRLEDPSLLAVEAARVSLLDKTVHTISAVSPFAVEWNQTAIDAARPSEDIDVSIDAVAESWNANLWCAPSSSAAVSSVFRYSFYRGSEQAGSPRLAIDAPAVVNLTMNAAPQSGHFVQCVSWDGSQWSTQKSVAQDIVTTRTFPRISCRVSNLAEADVLALVETPATTTCAAGEFKVSAAQGITDTVCSAVREECSATEYESSAPTLIADRACARCAGVENAALDAAVECTSPLDSRLVVAAGQQLCLDGFTYTPGTPDTCTAPEAPAVAPTILPTDAHCSWGQSCDTSVQAADPDDPLYACHEHQATCVDQCASVATSVWCPAVPTHAVVIVMTLDMDISACDAAFRTDVCAALRSEAGLPSESPCEIQCQAGSVVMTAELAVENAEVADTAEANLAIALADTVSASALLGITVLSVPVVDIQTLVEQGAVDPVAPRDTGDSGGSLMPIIIIGAGGAVCIFLSIGVALFVKKQGSSPYVASTAREREVKSMGATKTPKAAAYEVDAEAGEGPRPYSPSHHTDDVALLQQPGKQLVPPVQQKAARDGDGATGQPKADVIALTVAASGKPATIRDIDHVAARQVAMRRALTQELQQLKMPELRKRAVAASVPDSAIEEARDGDGATGQPKADVIALIVAASGKPARVKLYGPDVHV
jgi:hypothetical protein